MIKTGPPSGDQLGGWAPFEKAATKQYAKCYRKRNEGAGEAQSSGLTSKPRPEGLTK
jgi:hypothetical protein